MPKVAICERCGALKPLHLGSLTPGGWFDLQEHSTGPNPPAVVLCGVRCVELWAAARVTAEAAVVALVEREKDGGTDGGNGVH